MMDAGSWEKEVRYIIDTIDVPGCSIIIPGRLSPARNTEDVFLARSEEKSALVSKTAPFYFNNEASFAADSAAFSRFSLSNRYMHNGETANASIMKQ